MQEWQYLPRGTFSAPLAGPLGQSPPKCETQCLGQTSIAVQNFYQIRSAGSEDIHPKQTDRQTSYPPTTRRFKLKVKVWTLAIAPLTSVRLVSRDQQRFTISEVVANWHEPWCRSALCGHPLPALADNWTHGAASRHTITPISHTRPSPHSRSYYSFSTPLRVEGWVGLSTQ